MYFTLLDGCKISHLYRSAGLHQLNVEDQINSDCFGRLNARFLFMSLIIFLMRPREADLKGLDFKEVKVV